MDRKERNKTFEIITRELAATIDASEEAPVPLNPFHRLTNQVAISPLQMVGGPVESAVDGDLTELFEVGRHAAGSLLCLCYLSIREQGNGHNSS